MYYQYCQYRQNHYLCNMTALDEKYIDGNIPESYQWVQALLDRFVEINYNAALDAVRLHAKEMDAGHIRQQIVDIILNNPPLKSVPLYFRDGRENYLWYSDFYDEAGKDVFLKEYGKFEAPVVAITPASYAIELKKIDLPYFRALVDLVGLVKLEQEAERIERKKEIVAPVVEPAETTEAESVVQIEEVTPVDEPEPLQPPSEPQPAPASEPEPIAPIEQPSPKRSYEPKLSNEQYSLLAKCVEQIKLFRRPVSVSTLKKLLNGKLTEPLQVMNQLPLVYLLDQLRDAKLIKRAWMTTAFENRDVISFRTEGLERRYGPGPHYLTMDQYKSRRHDSRHKYIDGGNEIDDMIESMQGRRAK
jgi:hypothetical protein